MRCQDKQKQYTFTVHSFSLQKETEHKELAESKSLISTNMAISEAKDQE